MPYPDSERLVRLGESTGKTTDISVTWLNFKNWRSSNLSFESMAAYQFTNLTLTGRPEALIIASGRVNWEATPKSSVLL